ncbi:MAG: hypothetical protein PUC00_12015 [Clostridiales bacterium]|nr:hypothetical protein [Clostridiales bacterium]
MTALDIYQQDIRDQQSGTLQPRQQYYARLRDALHQELMQQGYSELLEELLEEIRAGKLERIYVLDYAVLMECHSMIVLGRRMRDASAYVPHLHLRGEKVMWEALEQPGSFVMALPLDFPEKLRQLRSVSRQLVDARDDTVLPQADSAAQREIEQVHALNKLLEERCKALEEEREVLKGRIRDLEEGVITQQVRYAIEARRIQEEEALRAQCEAQRGVAKEAFRAQYAQEQQSAALRRAQEEQQAAAQAEEAARAQAAVRQEMAADLRQLIALLEGKARAWEDGMRGADLRMLASCYVALDDLLNRPMAQLALDAQCAGTDAAVLADIALVQGTLADRVRQLEQAMARLGLMVIRPSQGDLYQPAWHLSTAARGAQAGAPIARCTHPGVKLEGAAEALIKAEVWLE